MKIVAEAKITVLELVKNSDKVTMNASKPCDERDLSCSGKVSVMPPR